MTTACSRHRWGERSARERERGGAERKGESLERLTSRPLVYVLLLDGPGSPSPSPPLASSPSPSRGDPLATANKGSGDRRSSPDPKGARWCPSRLRRFLPAQLPFSAAEGRLESWRVGHRGCQRACLESCLRRRSHRWIPRGIRFDRISPTNLGWLPFTMGPGVVDGPMELLPFSSSNTRMRKDGIGYPMAISGFPTLFHASSSYYPMKKKICGCAAAGGMRTATRGVLFFDDVGVILCCLINQSDFMGGEKQFPSNPVQRFLTHALGGIGQDNRQRFKLHGLVTRGNMLLE